jgi:hypothetical protein
LEEETEKLEEENATEAGTWKNHMHWTATRCGFGNGFLAALCSQALHIGGLSFREAISAGTVHRACDPLKLAPGTLSLPSEPQSHFQSPQGLCFLS